MLLSLKNISHCIEKKEIVKNISITLNPGDILTLYGPSGSGKTTLLQVLGGLISPTKGIITKDASLTDRQQDYGYAFVDGPFFEE